MGRRSPATAMACRASIAFDIGAATGACSYSPSTCSSSQGRAPRREPLELRKATLASVLRKPRPGLVLNEHLEHEDGDVVFRHACKLGFEGIVSKRLGSRYRSGHSRDWIKSKNPAAPAMKR